jgi:hypothetical protein
MQLYGKNYSVDALRKRMGSLDQVAGIRTFHYDDGRAKGVRGARIYNGSGLDLTVLPDRCLDIASASFNGQALGWRSSAGDVAPQYYEPEGFRWLRNCFGGLLTTCGLSQVGAPEPGMASAFDGRGLHGRISNTPAENVQVREGWQGDHYEMSITGTMREAVLFGENLSLTRTLSTRLGAAQVRLHDVVVNEGFRPAPLMILYHCNIGWPLVDEGSEIIAPARQVAPHTPHAAEGQEAWHRMEAPQPGYEEKVYHHDMAAAEDGSVTVAMVNNGFERGHGLGVYIRYFQDTLPRFVQWKMMGEQDYVCGLEPCNCGVEGQKVDEELGLLQVLAPGESREFRLEFGVLTELEEVNRLRAAVSSISPSFCSSYRDFVRP